MTETARLADYVLPASSQFEKYEATFGGRRTLRACSASVPRMRNAWGWQTAVTRG